MNAAQVYIAISIIVLAVIALLMFVFKKRRAKLTPLTGLAFGFILAGMIFGDERIVGYSLMGIGVILAFVDMIMRLKKK